MAFDRGDFRGKLYDLGIGLGKQITLDSIPANGLGVTHAIEFTGKQEGQLAGLDIYRPTVVAADQERTADIISSSTTLTHLGVAYGDLSILVCELIGLGLNASELNEIIQQMLRLTYFEDYWPLGWHVDNDFAGALTTTPHDWTSGAVNMTTIAKSTTGDLYSYLGQSGKRNLVLTGDGTGNGYVISSRLNVRPNDSLFHGAIGRCNDTGTASYVLYDVTNGAAIYTNTFAERAFQRIAHTDTIPSGCRQVEVRIGNVTASGVTEWDCLFGHLLGADGRSLVVPSFLSEQWRFLGFGPARYGATASTDLSNASSQLLETWQRGGQADYELYPLLETANPYKIQINKRGGLQAEDYWLHSLRPRSDIETFDNETDTSDVQEDEAMEILQYLLYDKLHAKWKDDRGQSEWSERRDYWKAQADARRLIHRVVQPTLPRPILRIGMRR